MSKRRTKQELEQLLADATAVIDQQGQTIDALTVSIQQLSAEAQDLRQDLAAALSDSYRGVEGARRWLADHIGYDLRQVAKCPTCLATNTTPTNPQEIGAEFQCLTCGQVFYIVKVLDVSAVSIRQAVKESRADAVVVESTVVRDDPYRDLGRKWRQLPSGQK